MLSSRVTSISRIPIIQLIFGFGIEGGGAGRLGIEIARRLNPEHFESMIVALWDCGSAMEKERIAQLREEGISAMALTPWNHRHPYSSFMSACRGLKEALRTEPAQIIHSHSEFGDIAVLPFAGKSVRLVRTIHNGYRVEWRKRPFRRLLLTNILYPIIFHREIAINRGIATSLNLRPVARLLTKKSVVIPNGIDLKRFSASSRPNVRSEIRHTLRIPEEAFVVGSAGRFAEGKGLDILLQAGALLSKGDKPVYFLLVGEGEQRTALENLADILGIRSRVVFTGPRFDMEQLFSCMDLFVSASFWEGISTAILESMAAGIPVLATAIPGNQEIIEDGVHGWLVPPGDVDSMKDALSSVIENPVERRIRAQQANARVQDFAIEAIVAKHEQLYWKLVGL